MKNSNKGTIDIHNDGKPLQTNNKISKCVIKQEITHVEIKTEVEDVNFEKYAEVPLIVENKTEGNYDIDDKSDLPNLQTKTQVSKYEIKQEITDMDIKNEVDNDNFEELLEDPLSVKIKYIYKDIKCDHCEKSFVYLFDLKRHIKAEHERIKVHKCDHCQKSFSQAGNLKRHIKAVHEGIKDHNCGHCGRGFSNTGDLKRHVKAVHEEIADHKCDNCEKSFTQAGTLRRHIKTVHEGIKNYRCNYCGNCFTRADSLELHVKTIHDGQRLSKYFHKELAIVNSSIEEKEEISEKIIPNTSKVKTEYIDEISRNPEVEGDPLGFNLENSQQQKSQVTNQQILDFQRAVQEIQDEGFEQVSKKKVEKIVVMPSVPDL